jgi:hypothetical protein
MWLTKWGGQRGKGCAEPVNSPGSEKLESAQVFLLMQRVYLPMK